MLAFNELPLQYNKLLIHQKLSIMRPSKKVSAKTKTSRKAVKAIDNRLRPALPKAAVNKMNSFAKLGMSISLIVKNLQQHWKNINYYDVWKVLGHPGSQKAQTA